MAGGKGTRFWPESTEKKPKQYLKIFNDKSLLTETCERFEGFIAKDHRYIVTVKSQQELCQKSSLNLINENGIIFEPSGRNTAPCILLSLLTLLRKGLSLNDVIAIVPSDHVILNQKGFHETLGRAFHLSFEQKSIVTIGITPHFPHTGFGYIEKGEIIDGKAFKVSRFVEKPHFELAKNYVESGNYLWNAGMFVAPIGILLEEFQAHAPLLYHFVDALNENLSDEEKLFKIYNEMPSDSIDYAIMEKSKRVQVVPAMFDWNDLGSWDALTAVIPEKNANTVVKSNGEVFLNSTQNIIYAPDKLVALINVQKHIVVVNENVILVAPIDDAQEIKKVVEKLKIQKPEFL